MMESGLGPGNSWKINQMVLAFLTRVHVSSLYIHYHCLLSDLVQHGSTILSSNTIKLQLLEIFDKSYQCPVVHFNERI